MDDNRSTDELQHNDNNDSKRKTKLILLFIIIFVLIFCAVIFVFKYLDNRNTTPPPQTQTSEADTTAATQNTLIDNPIDFDTLQKGNNEIYAWIKIDDTKVDYPICQSRGNDSFYLRHAAEDRSWLSSGAIYTEMCNNLSFTDPITLVYGHNGYGDTMFTTLHYFENREFFDNHKYFHIYTTSHKLTYEIFSAFKYDNRHIMNSFDFSDKAVLSDFQKEITNPVSALVNTREDLSTTIDTDSRIVILSTCITNQKSSRYLVCGVLVKDEKTN